MPNILNHNSENLRKLAEKVNFAKLAYEKRREAEKRFESGYVDAGNDEERSSKEIEQLFTNSEYQDAALRVISSVDKAGVINDTPSNEE